MLTITIWLLKLCLKNRNQNKMNDNDKIFILSHNQILSFRSASKPTNYRSWNCFRGLCSEVSLEVPYMGLLSSVLP